MPLVILFFVFIALIVYVNIASHHQRNINNARRVTRPRARRRYR